MDAHEKTANHVRLRPVTRDDFPVLYQQQLDEEANQRAMTRPRSAENFDEHWGRIVVDPSVVARSIIADDALSGCISCFQLDGKDYVGYWIGKEFWGKGIATRALQQLLIEVTRRPIHSRVAVGNAPSIRVLAKCGFREVGREFSAGTERYLECVEVLLSLE